LRLTQKLSKKGRFAKVSPLALPGGGRLVRIRVFKMGFIKEQQKRLAVRFLSWQYEKKNLPMPTRIELRPGLNLKDMRQESLKMPIE